MELPLGITPSTIHSFSETPRCLWGFDHSLTEPPQVKRGSLHNAQFRGWF